MEPSGAHNQSVIPESRHTRRRFLRTFAGAAGLLGVPVAGIAGNTYVFATDDSDHDDDEDHSGSGRDGEDDTPVITGEIPAGSIEIRIVDDDTGGFVPGNLTVDLGQSVTFVNAHHDEHTATGPGFDTGIIEPGGTATIVLNEAGTFADACQIHPEMTGSISVRNAEGEVPAQEEASPEASSGASDPTGAWTVTLTGPSGSSLASLQALVTFRADGTLEATYGEEAAGLEFVLGPGHGVWLSEGDSSYRMTTVIFLLDSEQRIGGTLTFQEDIQLDESGDAFQGTFTFEVKDTTGEIASSGQGKSEGTRIQSVNDATPEASPASGSDGATTTTIAIRDFAFDPSFIEIPTGTTVIWSNDGEAPHTATSLDGAFDTGQLDPGEEGQFTFDQPGIYDCRCDFHPNMQATIVVT